MCITPVRITPAMKIMLCYNSSSTDIGKMWLVRKATTELSLAETARYIHENVSDGEATSIDLQNRILNIDHQLQRTSKMEYVIQTTKTNAGKRQIPITEEVARCFQAIIEDREKPRREPFVDGYCGFLNFDENGMPLVALHWEHRFNRMVSKYNEIYRVQMPNITPHICRHTYCSNQAKAGMNPKTLQYLMGHSEIGVTLDVYTHLGAGGRCCGASPHGGSPERPSGDEQNKG